MSNETKNELIKRLRPSRYFVSGHGGYENENNLKTFIVPKNTIYIFLSKAARFMCGKHILNNNTKRFFMNKTTTIPTILKNYKTRTYGPGEIIHNLNIQLHGDGNDIIPMGVYKLPMTGVQFFIKGNKYGKTIKLSELTGGIFYIGACRGLSKQSLNTNQNKHINYPSNIAHIAKNLINRNKVSSSHVKRKRIGNNNTTYKKVAKPSRFRNVSASIIRIKKRKNAAKRILK